MKWLTLLFGMFILLVIVLADAGRLGVLAYVNRIPFGDKIGHFVLYGTLALLINLTLFRSFPHIPGRHIAIASSLILALLIGLEEFSQQLFAERSFSLADLAASYLGVLFFGWLAVPRQKSAGSRTPAPDFHRDVTTSGDVDSSS